jgi:predicted ABC-type ATPase
LIQKSSLHVFGGPNGAGKSTLFTELSQTPFFANIVQVNGDVIYKENPLLTQDQLAAVVTQRIKEHLTGHTSFSID